MQTYRKVILTLFLFFYALSIFAQDEQAAAALLKEGIALHDARKYDDAVAKYDQALKIDPDNASILFEKGFSLTSAGKSDQAIPILEKVAALNKEPSAFDLLGSIYDDKGEYDKAVKYYQAGIAAFPGYQRLKFNLSVSYLRQDKYAESEQMAIEAIKLDPRHASSHRAYALATFGQGKHVNSVLAWCSFLLAEPQTQRSVEACKYLKHILYSSIKGNNITLTSDTKNQAGQLSISIAVQAGLALVNKINGTATPLDSLTAPLPSIFRIAGQVKDKETSSFFSKYFADYFAALAATDNMTTFGRYITLSVYANDNLAWLKAHEPEVKALSSWVNATKRETE